jgi:hypothetical protein
MPCQLYRTNGVVDKVLAPNEKPSQLYAKILETVKKEGVEKFLNSIPYLRDRIADGTLINDSVEEVAVGIWSIAYTPEYQAFFGRLSKAANVFADENGEPKFDLFKNILNGNDVRFIRASTGYVLDPQKQEFLKGAAKRANALQKKIIETLVEKPDNPVVLEPEAHVYIDQDGEVYDSITKGIKGELTSDAYAVNRDYGTAIDKLLQGIVLGKKFDEVVADINNIDRAVLKNAFNVLQVYIDGLTKDGSVVITQVMLADKASKRAGSLDLLVISPSGRVKIIDLKTSKNSVNTSNYDKPWGVNNGSVFMGEKISTRQQHAIQVGAYKKLVELLGFDVDEISTVHLNIKLDGDNKVTDIDWEGEVRHSISSNQDRVDRLIPTEVPNRERVKELLKELGIDNPADDPDFLSDEEKKPERERFGDMFERMYQDVQEIINVLEARKKYLEKIRHGKTRVDKNVMIDKITELMVMMGSELKNDTPSLAYGSFLRYATTELKSYLADITNPNSKTDPDYVSLLLEVDKYVESYRGMVNIKNVGNKEQQAMLMELLGLLDDTKEAIDDNLQQYVRNVVKTNTSRDLTEDELNGIMKEVYDIKAEDYALGDLATSSDTLLAIADKIYKAASNKAKDQQEATASRILALGSKLLAAAGVSKPDSKFFDFMKVFNKAGEFTGRFVTRVGQQYWEMYYNLKNTIREKSGENKQYIPILDITKASKEDLEYNIKLHEDKKIYRDFMNAEILGPNGAEDGKYHKYSDAFKTIRSRYQSLVSYEKEDGTLFYKWEKKEGVTDEQYELFRIKYFNKADYWGVEYENDGVYRGRVSLKSGWFVKQDFVEIRDIAEDGTDLRDAKYVKLMNPQTALEKAQAEFYKGWVQEYEAQLEKLNPEVAAQMRGKVGRIRGKMMEMMKAKGGSFTKAMAKSMRDFFSSEVYTDQRLVDELGQIDRGLPVMYVGKLQNEGRVEYLKKELDNLKNKRATGKITQKEYLEEKKKLKEYLKIEEGKVKASEIEGDLVQNLITFSAMAENFEVMSNIEDDLLAVANIMEQRTYYQTDSVGRRLIAKGSKMTKTDDGTSVVKRPEDVLATKRLKKWFQMVYYNNQEFNRSTVAMVAKRIQNFTSLKGIGFNIFGGINNYVMARINNSIEAAGALYYDRPAANRAVKEYNADYLPGVFRGLGKSKDNYYAKEEPNSKYEAMVEHFRIVKKYQEDAGKIDAMSWAYMFQEGGEYNAQSKTGIAILMTRMLTNKNTGETLSVYDAFDFDPNTGHLKLKDGFEMTDKERYDTTNYILEVNKQIHGNYAFEDRMVIQEHWLGQLAAQFHKWVYPAYKVRFKERYIDENLGAVEGRYVTVMNFVKFVKEAEGGFMEKLRTGWKDMDPVQVKNMYKNIAELAFFAASFAMYGIFKSLSEGVDKDDKTLKRWVNFMAYQQSRQMNEITTLMPVAGVEEQYMLAKSPIAILTTLKDFGEAVKSTTSIPFPPYDKNYYERGVHKDQLKAWKEWKDIIPALSLLNKWDSYDNVKSFYIK